MFAKNAYVSKEYKVSDVKINVNKSLTFHS